MNIFGCLRWSTLVASHPSRGRDFVGRSGTSKRLGVMATVAVVIGGGFMTLGVAQASAATTGSISGTVTAASGGAPLSGICVTAQPTGGGVDTYTTTAADGTYTFSGLATGSYGVQFNAGMRYDVQFNMGICANSGNYVTQWYNNETSFGSANPVSVTVGSTTPSINAAMQPGGTFTGTVTAAVGGAALGGICVSAILSGGTPGYGYATTASNGTYSMTGLAAGSYTAQFQATGSCRITGNYVTQWYNNETSSGSANPVSVTVGGTTPSINAAMQPGGTITGTITDTSSPTPNDLQGICVYAIQSGGGPGYGQAATASNGTYSLTGLPAGSYIVGFSSSECGNSGNYVAQWYNNETSAASANPVSVTVGSTTPSINAAMQPGGTGPPPPPAPPSGATSSQSCSSSSPSGTCSATNAGTTVSANGEGSLTVSQYGSDPVGSPTFSASGVYLYVEVASGSSFSSLTITDCNLNGATSLEWWTGSAWLAVSSESYSAGPPQCVTATLDSTTIPAIGGHTDTVFAGALPATTVPGAPTGLGATPGNTTATLSWTAPSSNGGSTITGYDVYEGTTPGGESTTPVNGTTLIGATSYTVTGLTNGTNYYYKVSAVNGVGESAKSAEMFATPATTPGAPQSLTARQATSRGVTLSWAAPASNGGAAITGYKLNRSTRSSRETSHVTVTCTPINGTCSYTDLGTISRTTYYYNVAATNPVGTGPVSNQASARAR